MKRTLTHPISVVVLLLVLTRVSYAQQHSVYLGIGMAGIRGETTDQPIMQEEYSMNYQLKYFMPLNDERFVFSAEAGIMNIRMEKDFGSDENLVNYQNRVTHSYMGFGMRFYMNNKVNVYNPYRGQILPFIGVGIGAVNSISNSNRTNNAPVVSFKKPNSDPTEGYEFTEGSTYEFTGQVEGGLVYVINSTWSVEGVGMARPGFADNWDGIKGTSGTNDWFVCGGLGVHFRF